MAQGNQRLAAIEAGGTKFVLAIGDAQGNIFARRTIPTHDPETTLGEAADWFAAQGGFAAIGIACFGPVELDRASPKWGHVIHTPKPGWLDYDVAGHFARRFGAPVGFDTDVNGAALGEYRLGAGRGAAGLAYLTVGTGIGGGLVIDGRTVHGAGHPEMGHVYPRRAADDHDFAGTCPFHGDCAEGLASGTAIRARWGHSLSELPPDHPAHARVAGYVAQLCHSLFAIAAVERIVLGGGVMSTPGLLDRVRAAARAIGGDYLPGRDRQEIVAPGLGQNSGIVGALLLAAGALEGRR